jgi:hypothetical protein
MVDNGVTFWASGFLDGAAIARGRSMPTDSPETTISRFADYCRTHRENLLKDVATVLMNAR